MEILNTVLDKRLWKSVGIYISVLKNSCIKLLRLQLTVQRRFGNEKSTKIDG